jgi:hypothetical protein
MRFRSSRSAPPNSFARASLAVSNMSFAPIRTVDRLWTDTASRSRRIAHSSANIFDSALLWAPPAPSAPPVLDVEDDTRALLRHNRMYSSITRRCFSFTLRNSSSPARGVFGISMVDMRVEFVRVPIGARISYNNIYFYKTSRHAKHTMQCRETATRGFQAIQRNETSTKVTRNLGAILPIFWGRYAATLGLDTNFGPCPKRRVDAVLWSRRRAARAVGSDGGGGGYGD